MKMGMNLLSVVCRPQVHKNYKFTGLYLPQRKKKRDDSFGLQGLGKKKVNLAYIPFLLRILVPFCSLFSFASFRFRTGLLLKKRTAHRIP